MHFRHSLPLQLVSGLTPRVPGPVGAVIVGLLAGVGTLSAARFVFDAIRSRAARLLMIALFAAPAALAGYYVVLGLGRLIVPSEGWQHVFAAMGALIIGLTAAVRLSGSGRASARARTRILTAQATRSTP